MPEICAFNRLKKKKEKTTSQQLISVMLTDGPVSSGPVLMLLSRRTCSISVMLTDGPVSSGPVLMLLSRRTCSTSLPCSPVHQVDQCLSVVHGSAACFSSASCQADVYQTCTSAGIQSVTIATHLCVCVCVCVFAHVHTCVETTSGVFDFESL